MARTKKSGFRRCPICGHHADRKDIGGNIYGLETTLKDGEYATVNSITKKIRQYSVTGEETNIFDKRDRENNIFQKMPEGTLPVLRSKDMQVDITLYDERGEPEWI